MANSFTKSYVDGDPLLESDLDAGFGTVQPTLSNLALSTTGSSANDLLQSSGSNLSPAFVTPNTVAATITATGANSIIGVVSSVQASVANLILGKVSSVNASIANLIVNTVTRSVSTSVGTLGISKSISTGSFQTSSSTFVDVSNGGTTVTCTITTSGRPVRVELINDDTSSATGYLSVTCGVNGTLYAQINLSKDTGALNTVVLGASIGAASGIDLRYPPSSISIVDTNASSGTHVYSMQAQCLSPSSNSAFRIYNCKLIAYEL